MRVSSPSKTRLAESRSGTYARNLIPVIAPNRGSSCDLVYKMATLSVVLCLSKRYRAFYVAAASRSVQTVHLRHSMSLSFKSRCVGHLLFETIWDDGDRYAISSLMPFESLESRGFRMPSKARQARPSTSSFVDTSSVSSSHRQTLPRFRLCRNTQLAPPVSPVVLPSNSTQSPRSFGTFLSHVAYEHRKALFNGPFGFDTAMWVL